MYLAGAFKKLHEQIFTFTFSRRFYPKRLTVHSCYTFVLSVCVKYKNKTLYRLIPFKETVLTFSLCWCFINIKGIIHPRIKID